jgi:hypothetical protein
MSGLGTGSHIFHDLLDSQSSLAALFRVNTKGWQTFGMVKVVGIESNQHSKLQLSVNA